MAIVKGNSTAWTGYAANPFTSITRSHNQDAGTDKLLVIHIQMFNSALLGSATYAGQAMTLAHEYEFDSQNWGCYYLIDPPDGTDNIVVNFVDQGGLPSAQANPISFFAQSFIGASGVDVTTFETYSTSPRSQTISMLPDSLVILSGFSTQPHGGGSYTVEGNTLTESYEHNVVRYAYGAVSSIPIANPTSTCVITMDQSWKDTVMHIVEILDAGGSGPTGGEGDFLLVL